MRTVLGKDELSFIKILIVWTRWHCDTTCENHILIFVYNLFLLFMNQQPLEDLTNVRMWLWNLKKKKKKKTCFYWYLLIFSDPALLRHGRDRLPGYPRSVCSLSLQRGHQVSGTSFISPPISPAGRKCVQSIVFSCKWWNNIKKSLQNRNYHFYCPWAFLSLHGQ